MKKFESYKRVKDWWAWLVPGMIFLTVFVAIPLILFELYLVAGVLILVSIIVCIPLIILERKFPRKCPDCQKRMDRYDPSNPVSDTVHHCDKCKTKVSLVGRHYG